MREKVEKIICDHCKKWIDKEKDFVFITNDDGMSDISFKGITLDFEEKDFCNLTCLFAYVREYFSQDGCEDA